ncbi:3-deoxy-7-phosphoheptulonate synthase [Gracilaria domingensis]|nr:3-deoxy-7-phosphoheptulonate synthase [Gracilaria domingensis]
MNLASAHSGDESDSARLIIRVENIEQLHKVARGERRPALDTNRIGNATHKLYVSAVRLSGTVAEPEEVARGGVVLACSRILSTQGLLVRKQQTLVRDVKFGLLDLVRIALQANGLHEGNGVVNAIGILCVLATLRGVAHKLQTDVVHAVEIKRAARGQGTQQVDGRRGLHKGLVHALGVRHTFLQREASGVDDISAIGRKRQLLVLLLLVRTASRLCKLAGGAQDLDDGPSQGVHEHDGHLDDQGEGVGNVLAAVGIKLLEGLCAVAALDDKGVAFGRGGEQLLERLALAREDERQGAAQAGLHVGERARIGVVGHLLDGHGAPAVGRPQARGGGRLGGDHARRGARRAEARGGGARGGGKRERREEGGQHGGRRAGGGGGRRRGGGGGGVRRATWIAPI